MSKHPTCPCNQKRFDYFRKRYRNGTLHLIRRCGSCGKAAQNPMRQDEYDRNWVESLPVLSTNGVIENTPQSRADVIVAKLQNHIETRNANL